MNCRTASSAAADVGLDAILELLVRELAPRLGVESRELETEGWGCEEREAWVLGAEGSGLCKRRNLTLPPVRKQEMWLL